MKWLLLVLPGGVLLCAALWIYQRVRPTCVSTDWLLDQDRRDTRNTYEGVCIDWPINKVVNDSAFYQTRKLRRSA